MKKRIIPVILSGICLLSSCDFLNVVPDNVATIDNAFANELEARKYLATIYSYLPDHDDIGRNIALYGSDEVTSRQILTLSNEFYPMRLVYGQQNVNEPILSYWSGDGYGKNYYEAIRDCNIFLENVSDEDKISDLTSDDRRRWLGEAYFLKAYYTFYMMRMYGPVILMKENLPIDASVEEVRQKRAPFDECVDYVCELLDLAAERLPDIIQNEASELGRATRPAALMLKAKVLTTAASPLFNGNPDYAGFTDKDGVHLMSTEFSQEKWERAEEACSLAVDACHKANISLYEFKDNENISDVTRRKLSINNAATLRWNSETVWSLSSRNDETLQAQCMARLNNDDITNINGGRDLMNPTIEITEKYYTENGVPINEDKTWDYNGRYDLVTTTEDTKYDLIPDYTVTKAHLGREPRFYAHLAFDGSKWWLQNAPGDSDEDTYTVQCKAGQNQGKLGAYNYSLTGYWCKKLVNYKYELTTSGSGFTAERYPWPEMRLGDLYLLYAECLNECGNSDLAIEYVDKIRERAGLKGVAESWTNYSITPDKYTTKDGLREIIHRERTVEMMFEGSRYWDLMRWKEAASEWSNASVSGWDVEQESAEGYYHRQPFFTRRFVAPRDYLWPIKEYDIIVNPNLVQNPGW